MFRSSDEAAASIGRSPLLQLCGLSTLIDERLFGDANWFRSQYTEADGGRASRRYHVSSAATSNPRH